MNCLETRKYLSAFIDSELDTRTNIDVVEHVRMCARCEGRMEELNALKSRVEALMKSARAPQALRDRIMEGINDPAAHKRGVGLVVRELASNGWVRALAAAASILIVFTLVYVVLLRPPAALNSGAISEHMAFLRDQIPTFLYTTDAERATRRAFVKIPAKPAVPLIDAKEFQLIGAGPAEIELKDVGHFVFRYRSEVISMFVFEGLQASDVGGSERQTQLGPVKIDSRRGLNIVAWNAGNFSYVLVSRMAVNDLLDKIAPAVLSK